MTRPPILAVVVLVFLAGCQEPLTVLVSPEVSDLLPAVRAAVTQSGVRATVTAESERWPGGSGLRITTTPGWNLPAGAPPASRIPQNGASDYQTAGALAALADAKAGTVSVLPVVFDLWGTTVFPQTKNRTGPAPRGPQPQRWLVAGARPSFRQAAVYLWGALSLPPGNWFASPSPPTLAAAVQTAARRPEWAAGTWRYAQPDLLQSYRAGAPFVFFETYRDYERETNAGFREFRPLAVGSPATVAGIVVFAEIRGSAAAWDPLLRQLVSAGFQQSVERGSGWLAVNLLAPEIDGEGAAVRNLVKLAGRFAVTSDRLPAALTERNRATDIELAFEQAPNH